MRNDINLWEWWKKYGEHLTAPFILIALITLGFMLFNDRQLKEKINLNCGWGEDDYKCYCEKSEAMKIKNKIDGKDLPFINISNG